ncbi:hypothetical protein ACLSZR_01405 [Avibacterium avium]|uniref:hypothetical protein n=2 Tax=Avibacterium avium TaxID=751 RepID=UPI003BF7F37F
MYYLTNNNLGKFLAKLDFNEAFYNYGYSYYNNELKEFDIDLHFFTKDEAKNLVIAEKIYFDLKVEMDKYLIIEKKNNQKKWVFEIHNSSFHADRNCEKLKSSFSNYEMPKVKNPDEYRAYFEKIFPELEAWNGIDKKREFSTIIKEKFSLEEDLDFIVKHYLTPVNKKNSGVTYTVIDINENIEEFKVLTEKCSKDDIRSAYFKKNDPENGEYFEYVYNLRKNIYSQMLFFYISKTLEKGLEINEELLKLTGFSPCSCCKK